MWQLEFSDRTLARYLDGIAMVEGLSHPYSSIVAVRAMGSIRVLRREVNAARQGGEMLIRDCTEMGFWPRGRGYAAAIKEIRGTNFGIRGNKKSTLSVLFRLGRGGVPKATLS